MTQRRPLSYQLLQVREDGVPRTYARLTCSRCGAHLDTPIFSDDNHNSLVERRARYQGWLYNKHTARKCICSACYLGSTDAIDSKPNEAETHYPVAGAISAGPSRDTALAAAFQAAAAEKEKKIMPTPPVTSKPAVGSPTPDQKMKIREFLDGNYDERLKCYVDAGTTDKSAGETLGVPWSWVRDLREVAYGPLEGDPELMEIRSQVDRLGKQLMALSDRLKKAEERRL